MAIGETPQTPDPALDYSTDDGTELGAAVQGIQDRQFLSAVDKLADPSTPLPAEAVEKLTPYN